MIIIDSNYIGYVTKFALSQGLTYRGGRTEVIFGFLKNIISIANRFETGNVVFCWDSKNSLRKEIYPDYKKKRKENRTEEMIEGDIIAFRQFGMLRRTVLPMLGFNNIFIQDGIESDDLMASIVMDSKLAKHKKTIVSSDNDLLQLLDYCTLYNASKHTIMTRDLFVREYGITPDQWVDVKTLAGCSSDNVAGISGVGNKKAIKYLKGELKGKAFETINNRKRSESRLIRKLVRLPFPDTRECVLKENSLSVDKYISVCKKFGFDSMLKESAINSWKKLMGDSHEK